MLQKLRHESKARSCPICAVQVTATNSSFTDENAVPYISNSTTKPFAQTAIYNVQIVDFILNNSLIVSMLS